MNEIRKDLENLKDRLRTLVEQDGDPITTLHALRSASAEAAELMELSAALQGAVLRQHAEKVGAAQAAKDVGLSRSRVYALMSHPKPDQ